MRELKRGPRNKARFDESGQEVCKNSHLFTEENTYICPQGYKVCKICRRASYNRHIQNVKELEKRRSMSLQQA